MNVVDIFEIVFGTVLFIAGIACVAYLIRCIRRFNKGLDDFSRGVQGIAEAVEKMSDDEICAMLAECDDSSKPHHVKGSND